MQKKKILSLAIATATVVTGLVGVTTAATPTVDPINGDITICGTEYISDSNGSVGCITIQGKNVGATTTGAGPDAPSTSYGNYYQYGDNTPRTESNWFTGQVWNFFPPDFTGCLSADNAWGGGSDNNQPVYPIDNESERQGPCDTGYHVPSKGEWYALMDMWYGSSRNGRIYDIAGVEGFYTDFQIPFAGERNYDDGSLVSQGGLAIFWSSTTRLTMGIFDCKSDSVNFFVYHDKVGSDDRNNRANGYSVRCFKDSALDSSSSEGGDSEIVVNIAALNGGQNTCTLDNYIFSGIFASPSVVFRNISQSMHCIFGNANGSVVTLQLSGDLTDGSGNTIPAGNVRLKNTAWTATPAAVQGASSAIGDYTSLNQTLTLFNKVANKIGEATGSAVDIQVEIPGGTPDGVYNGTLVLSY